jgi:hypothetical protein
MWFGVMRRSQCNFNCFYLLSLLSNYARPQQHPTALGRKFIESDQFARAVALHFRVLDVVEKMVIDGSMATEKGTQGCDPGNRHTRSIHIFGVYNATSVPGCLWSRIDLDSPRVTSSSSSSTSCSWSDWMLSTDSSHSSTTSRR